MPSPYAEKTLYFEVDQSNADMLADDTYDAFVLVPLYLAMYHKQDLHIRGNISKKLYNNVKWYIPKILCDFWDALSPVKFTVDGFTSVKRNGNLIGTGISCGVDSLSTIYDHFIKETDPDYRINALFMFNCGTHGDYEDPFTQKLFISRYHRNVNAANELGLPVTLVNSNMHAFTHRISETKVGYFSIYSCVLSLQNALSLYYAASDLDYEGTFRFRKFSHDRVMNEFCGSYILPLIQTDNLELIIDGCQYRRVDKVKNIADWDIAQKYLNVCVGKTADASNCGHCSKCLRTLLPLEILGKLDKFSRVFNIEQYRQISFQNKIRCLQNYGEEPFETENVDLARENNFPMPTKRDCYVLGENAIVV